MKTILIHIGGRKTGTKSIQAFLSLNRNNLLRQKIRYPGKEESHVDLALDLGYHTLMHLPKPDDSLKDETLLIFREIESAPEPFIIISSEYFEGFTTALVNDLKSYLPDNARILILYYVRRQDHMIESHYNQLIRQADHYADPFVIPFQKFYEENKDNYDYNKVISPWSEVFGKEQVIIRCYEKNQLADGLLSDFLRTCNIAQENLITPAHQVINQSFTRESLEIMRLCNIAFADNLQVRTHIMNQLARYEWTVRGKKATFLSPQQRRDLVSYYDEANQKMAREYLHRNDGILFTEPVPLSDEPWDPYPGLSAENMVPVMGYLMHEMVTLRWQVRTPPGWWERIFRMGKSGTAIPRILRFFRR